MNTISFPEYTGLRCLMMPYVQGDPDSLPTEYQQYADIVAANFLSEGDRGFLTIDESPVTKGVPHRGARAKFGRALHTEVGMVQGETMWGGPPVWGSSHVVTVDPDVGILLANSLDGTCALWDAVHSNTSEDGDIGDQAHLYPYETATVMRASEVYRIGVFTPHESLPVAQDGHRQFLRIVGSGVHGREPYFTVNPVLKESA